MFFGSPTPKVVRCLLCRERDNYILAFDDGEVISSATIVDKVSSNQLTKKANHRITGYDGSKSSKVVANESLS